MPIIESTDRDVILLKKFNNRDSDVFGEIYNRYYKELHYYASTLYAGSDTDPKDIIQDVFIDIWQNRKLQFDSLRGIKSYIYVVIKNKFRMHYNHLKVVEKANRYLVEADDIFVVHAAEAEVFSLIPSALNILPSECAKSFKLFLEGWDVDEIAAHLGKKRSTIYNQKNDALVILRRFKTFFVDNSEDK